MARIGLLIAVTLLAVALNPRVTTAQDADHAHDPGTAAHSHASAPVNCTTLGSPPWTGLADIDRQRFSTAHQSVIDLSTPEAAIAAGFRPALGDIPGMGIHYVNSDRGRDGIHIDQPDHLLFAPIDGEEKLVGAAYAFIDVPATDEPIPFDSELAHWHDHPQFAPDGQTLHMLHLWFIPSSSGPFAGLNFWLPYEGAGITPPSSCWMSDPEISQQIQEVSFALVPADNPLLRGFNSDQESEGDEVVSVERQQLLDDLDAAARESDLNGWINAAEGFLSDLTPRERMRTRMLLRGLTDAQMSSAEREEAGRN